MDAVATRTDPVPAPLEAARQQQHPNCFVCAPENPFGLKLAFSRTDKNRVEATFPCGWFYQGFPGKVHGGIVSALLDGAMVHALMAEGIEAVTADLQVRFILPVELGLEARVIGENRLRKGTIHHLTASVEQGGQARATARARFFETRKASEPRTRTHHGYQL